MSEKALARVTGAIAAAQPQIEEMLPEHVPFDKFRRTTLMALQRDPKLAAATGGLFEAILRCAADGLLPDGREAALVLFKGRAQYMPMVHGIIKRVTRSGHVRTVTAAVVYDADAFRYWLDETGPHIHHEPTIKGDRGRIVAAYAIARLATGEAEIEVLHLDDIERIRATSRSSGGGPWSQWYDQMAIKSAIRRLAKRLPIPDDVQLHEDEIEQAATQVAQSPTVSTPSANSTLQLIGASDDDDEDNPFDAEEEGE